MTEAARTDGHPPHPEAAPGTPAVRITALTKDYTSRTTGTVRALDAAELTIEQGEFFSLLGPSGSGKTTLLRLIAGFEHPTAGRIDLAGRDVTALPPSRRDVHTVFQDYALFPSRAARSRASAPGVNWSSASSTLTYSPSARASAMVRATPGPPGRP